MKYTKEYIVQLLRKFKDDTTTEEEEQQLADYFQQGEVIPKEWNSYKVIFQSFKTDIYDFTEDEKNEFFHEGESSKRGIVKILPWLAAACVAAIVIFCFVHIQTTEYQDSIVLVKHSITNNQQENQGIRIDQLSEMVSDIFPAAEKIEMQSEGNNYIVTTYEEDGDSFRYFLSMVNEKEGTFIINMLNK